MAGMKKVLEGFAPKRQNMDWSDAAADFLLTADRPPDNACIGDYRMFLTSAEGTYVSNI